MSGRTRPTWLAYLLLCGYAYLQVVPGAVVPFLRAELGLGYATAALHVTMFAAGSVLAGITGPLLERRIGRTATAWLGAAGCCAGALALAAGRSAPMTLGAALLMGGLGTWVLVGVQSALADEHGERRAVALSESNALASLGALAAPALISAGESAGPGWRTGLYTVVALLAVLAVAFRGVRMVAAPAQPGRRLRPSLPASTTTARLAGPVWAGLALVFLAVAVEWCIGFWAASFLKDVVGLPAAAAVGASSGFYAAMLAGRISGAVLARRRSPALLVAVSLAVSAVGFPLFWLASDPVLAVAGLVVAGLGAGNLFPLSLALTIAAAPGRSTRISARAVQLGALAVLSLPLTVGALAGRLALRQALAVIPVLLALAAVAWWATVTSARFTPTRPAAGRTPGAPGSGSG